MRLTLLPDFRSTRRGWWLAFCAVCLTLVASNVAAAQSDSPSGGGTGCVSNGNCQGSVYKDKSNLDRWWWRTCSGCHVVQAREPADAVTALTSFQKEIISDKRKFKAFHDMTLADPALKILTPKTRMVDPRLVRSPYKELLQR